MNLKIKQINQEEVEIIAKIHIQALANDVLPSLGMNVLINYYKNIIGDESQKLFGILNNKDIIGFCLISTKSTNLKSAILNIDGILSCLRLSILKPSKIYSGLLQLLKTRKIMTPESAEISFIAVLPQYQGKSVGRKLLKYGNDWCCNRSIKFLKTKTSNKKLLRYYVEKYKADIQDNYSICGEEYAEVIWETSFLKPISN